MRDSIKTAIGVFTMVLAASCADAPTVPRLASQLSLHLTGGGGATFVVTHKARGINELRKEFDWTFKKRVKAIMGDMMEVEPSRAYTDLPRKSVKWIEYEFIANRTALPDRIVKGMHGRVCVTNTGSGATDGLRIALLEPSGGIDENEKRSDDGNGGGDEQSDDGGKYAGGKYVDVSEHPVLAAGEQYCYEYERTLNANVGVEYRVVALVTVGNKKDSEQSAGENGTSAATTFKILPERATVVLDAEAVITEGARQSCANIFPAVLCTGSEGFHPVTLTDSKTFDGASTIDDHNFHVCGEDLPHTNHATLTEGPRRPGVWQQKRHSSATVVLKTGPCGPKPPNPGCTETADYWKKNAWPAHPFWAGATLEFWPDINDWKFFYSGVEWPDMLRTPVKKGDSYTRLAHQYIATSLNQQSDVYVPAEVRAALKDAYEYLSLGPGETAGKSEKIASWTSTFERYNTGRFGVKRCDAKDGSDDADSDGDSEHDGDSDGGNHNDGHHSE